MASVKLTYSDGTEETVTQPSAAQAERIAERYTAKIGRTFRLFNADFTQDSLAELTNVEFTA
jgi:hypothetical protein